jgi:hypothetical protein
MVGYRTIDAALAAARCLPCRALCQCVHILAWRRSDGSIGIEL